MRLSLGSVSITDASVMSAMGIILRRNDKYSKYLLTQLQKKIIIIIVGELSSRTVRQDFHFTKYEG